MRLQRATAAMIGAFVAAACFAAVPAEARDCRGAGRCAKVAHTNKLSKPAAYVSMKTKQRRADRRAPRRQPTYVVWHGWTGKASTFHLDGVAYPGGSRRGPASALNNWEGGFHPEAFWVLHLRSVSGI
jgi:hypothetical protein